MGASKVFYPKEDYQRMFLEEFAGSVSQLTSEEELQIDRIVREEWNPLVVDVASRTIGEGSLTEDIQYPRALLGVGGYYASAHVLASPGTNDFLLPSLQDVNSRTTLSELNALNAETITSRMGRVPCWLVRVFEPEEQTAGSGEEAAGPGRLQIKVEPRFMPEAIPQLLANFLRTFEPGAEHSSYLRERIEKILSGRLEGLMETLFRDGSRSQDERGGPSAASEAETARLMKECLNAGYARLESACLAGDPVQGTGCYRVQVSAPKPCLDMYRLDRQDKEYIDLTFDVSLSPRGQLKVVEKRRSA